MEYKEKACLCNWMQMLRPQIGNVPLNRVLIPGAHDSNTYSIPKVKALSVFARCQEKSLYSQMCIGVRFFDLRVGDFASAELREVIRKEMTQLESAQFRANAEPSTRPPVDSLKSAPMGLAVPQKPCVQLQQKMKIAKKFEKSLLTQPRLAKPKPKPKVDWSMNLSRLVDDYSQMTDKADTGNEDAWTESSAQGKDRSRLGHWDDLQNQSMSSITLTRPHEKHQPSKPTKFGAGKNNFLVIDKSREQQWLPGRRRPKKTVHVSKSVRAKSRRDQRARPTRRTGWTSPRSTRTPPSSSRATANSASSSASWTSSRRRPTPRAATRRPVRAPS